MSLNSGELYILQNDIRRLQLQESFHLFPIPSVEPSNEGGWLWIIIKILAKF